MLEYTFVYVYHRIPSITSIFPARRKYLRYADTNYAPSPPTQSGARLNMSSRGRSSLPFARRRPWNSLSLVCIGYLARDIGVNFTVSQICSQ